MKSNKALPSMSLVLALGASLAACGQSGQRDVYSGYNGAKRCADDWGTSDICQNQISPQDAQAMGLHPNYGGTYIYYWGPWWYGSSRSVYYGGNTYTPVASRAVGFASGSPGDHPSSFSPSPSVRGGFGATGRSFSVGVGE